VQDGHLITINQVNSSVGEVNVATVSEFYELSGRETLEPFIGYSVLQDSSKT